MQDQAKILVVEDDDTTARLICDWLKSEGYQTSVAYDGEPGLRMAEQELPDLVLLNVVMPEMDGFAVCQRLKSNVKTKGIPIIFESGMRDADRIAHGYDLGAEHYITKPFHPIVLLAQIRQTLRGRGYRNISPTPDSSKIPKVFVSYKWEDDTHNNWVMKLAVDLRTAGIEAILDRWDVRLGDSFTDYMTSKINEADVVLFIMTTASVAAVEAKDQTGGGVKFEMQLASSRKRAGEDLRIIPIYKEGNKTAAHVRDHRYADFRADAEYEHTLQLLIYDLLGMGPIAPPLSKSQK